MRRARKLRQLIYLTALLFLIFYIVDNTIPSNHQRKMRSNLFNIKGGGGGDNLEVADNAVAKLPETLQVQNILDCRCSRRLMYPPKLDLNAGRSFKTGSYFTRLKSSCSDEGTHYHTNQNVISFSMYYPQNSKRFIPGSPQTSPLNYQVGLLRNLVMTRKHYPGYSLRVYSSIPLDPRGFYCDLLCQNDDLFWCDIRKTPGYGDLSRMNFRTWRFLPLGDPTVQVFHSRDLDSLVSDREAAVARDWLSGKDHKAIMAMRDRKVGHDLPMLAGMWGADNSKLVGEGVKLRKQMILMSQLSSSQDKSFDQRLLSNVVFYPMAKDILAYDSYNCVKWSKFTKVRPFPVQRGDPATDFVGNRVNFTGDGSRWKYGIVECPLECRPSYGLDWVYC